jgi:Zn-dependent protease with chaperone function
VELRPQQTPPAGGAPIQSETLMQRVERDRRNRRRALIVFAGGSAVVVGATFLAAVASLRDSTPAVSTSPGGGITVTIASCGCAPAVLVATALAALGVLMLIFRKPDVNGVLAGLHAVPVAAGELPDTRRALEDMCVAAGASRWPALTVIDTPAVNAFAVGASIEAATVGVTRGLAEGFELDEQRAVFANLLARLALGNVPTAKDDDSPFEQADAEGMRLLRDPGHMVSALQKSLAAEVDLPFYPKAGVYHLFVNTPSGAGWAFPSGPDAIAARIAKLKAVVGAEALDR